MKRLSRRSLLMITILLLLGLLGGTVQTYAYGETVYLFTYERIRIYRRHSDEGNYCFWASDAVFTEAEAEQILTSSDPELELVFAMDFILREIGSFEEIDISLAEVEYSSLLQYQDREACPVSFSYDDGSGPKQITTYAYVLEEEEPTETEEETFTESEIPPPATEPETETPGQTEVPPEETRGTEPSKQEQTEIVYEYQQRVNEVVVRESTAATEAASDMTETTEAPTEHQETEEETELEIIHRQEVIVQEESEEPADTEPDKTGVTDKLMTSPLYVATFGFSSSAFLVFYVSITRDIRMLLKHRRRIIRSLKTMDGEKIKGGRKKWWL